MSCCCTMAATSPCSSRLSIAAMAGSSAVVPVLVDSVTGTFCPDRLTLGQNDQMYAAGLALRCPRRLRPGRVRRVPESQDPLLRGPGPVGRV